MFGSMVMWKLFFKPMFMSFAEEGFQDMVASELDKAVAAETAPEEGDPGAAAPAEGADKPAEDGSQKPPEQKPPEDPEFDLEFGEGDQKQIKKLKLSELKKGYMLNDDYTKKMQTFSRDQAEFKALTDWSKLVAKSPKFLDILTRLTKNGIADNGFNEAYLDKVISSLEDKREVAAQKTSELEAALQNLDPLDPNYAVFKQALEQNKALEKRLAEMDQKIQATEAKFSEVTQTAEARDRERAMQNATKIITDALNGMTDPNKPDSFKFETPEEQAFWRKEVLYVLSKNPRELKSEADLHALLKEVGQQVKGHMENIFEARLAKHLQKKQPPAAPSGKSGAAPAEEKPDKPIVEGPDLQSRIASMIDQEMKENKEQ